MTDVITIGGLILAAMVLIVAEIFLPSLGILGVAAVAALVWAVIHAFMIDGMVGLGVLLGILIVFPIYIALLIRRIPHGHLAKRIFLKQAEAMQPTSEQESLARLVGQEGVTETPLRLSGAVRINGRRYQAMAENDHIDAGQTVRVLRYDGMDLIVAPAN
jgi:membrane-bound serine protease (ClpP class)